jgi:NAD(P)-dependent dehydrogenase (short-subunit alcohol dehydrogenase family)
MRKVAVVTGCSYGLGHEICNRLIDEGYFVYGLSRSEPPMDLSSYPDTFEWVECDISNAKSVEIAFRNIGTYIDVLVNNAGVYEWGVFKHDSTPYMIDRMIDTNVKGTMYVTHQALKTMKEKSDIFFINSVAGLSEIQFEAVYSASKHAITAFAGILGQELNNQLEKIRVTSIHPGGMNTPMQKEHSYKDKFMDPKEVVDMMIHVLKAKSRYKTIKMFPESEWHE